MAGTISLYLRDDTLRKLDAEVARAAADDRAHGLTGRQVTNRSKFIERIIEDHLDTSTLPSKQDIRYHVASLSEQYGAAKVSLFLSLIHIFLLDELPLRQQVESCREILRLTAGPSTATSSCFSVNPAAKARSRSRSVCKGAKRRRALFEDAPSLEIFAESPYFLMALNASVCALMPRSAARRSMDVAPKKPSTWATRSMM